MTQFLNKKGETKAQASSPLIAQPTNSQQSEQQGSSRLSEHRGVPFSIYLEEAEARELEDHGDAVNLKAQGTYKKRIFKKRKPKPTSESEPGTEGKYEALWHLKELPAKEKLRLGNLTLPPEVMGLHMQIMADVQRELTGGKDSLYPKMRLVYNEKEGEKGKYYVMSKNVVGAKNFFGVEYDRKRKRYIYPKKESRLNLDRNKKSRGLLQAILLNYFIQEVDYNPENFMAVDDSNGGRAVLVIDKMPMFNALNKSDLESELRLLYKRFVNKELSLYDEVRLKFRVFLNDISPQEAFLLRAKGSIGGHMLNNGYLYEQSYPATSLDFIEAYDEFCKTLEAIEHNGEAVIERALERAPTRELAKMYEAFLGIYNYYENHKFLQKGFSKAGLKEQYLYYFIGKQLRACDKSLLKKLKLMAQEDSTAGVPKLSAEQKAEKVKTLYKEIFAERIAIYKEQHKKLFEQGIKEEPKLQIAFSLVLASASIVLALGIAKKAEILKVPQLKDLGNNIMLALSSALVFISVVALLLTINNTRDLESKQEVIPDTQLAVANLERADEPSTIGLVQF